MIFDKEERAEAMAAILDAIHEHMESVRFTGRMEFYNGAWGGIYGNAEQGFKRRVNGKFVPIEDGE